MLTCITGIILTFSLGGCKDSGSVGSTFPGSGSTVQVDTFQVAPLSVDTLSSFSGRLGLLSIGHFQDPALGDTKVTGLIKPFLSPADSTLSFDENTEMKLRLQIDDNSFYGDTLAQAQFNLVELASIFRSNSFRLNDDVPLAGNIVGSFTVEDDDSIDVQLADDWVQKYGSFYNTSDDNRDSLYLRQFFGLAIVPQNNAKIITVDPIQSRFIVTNLNIADNADITVEDSLSVGIRDYAFNLKRSNEQVSDGGSSIITNTLDRIFRFNFDFSIENLGTQNVSRVELVFYRDNLLLDQATSQPNVVRPSGSILRLHLVEGDELPQSIDPGSPLGLRDSNGNLITGDYQQEDKAYHINITTDVLARRLENIGPSQSFYVTLGVNNGEIRPTVLFNDQASAEHTPKVIITSIKTENN